MMRRHAGLRLIVIFACAPILMGCGGEDDKLPREPVWGKVTINGQPLARGAINFNPATPDQANPVSVGAVITDGEYSISRAEGPTPGSYIVAIIPSTAGPAPSLEEAPGAPPKDKTRKKQSDVKKGASVAQKVEIKAGGSNSFDFDVPRP